MSSCVKDNVSDNGTIYGLWNAKDILSSYHSSATYIVSVDRDIIDTSVINVSNLYGINGGGEYEGFVSCRRSGNTLTIFNCSLTGYHFSGTGTYDVVGRTITWNYTVSTPEIQNDQVYTQFTKN
jgi:hypothetical protein